MEPVTFLSHKRPPHTVYGGLLAKRNICRCFAYISEGNLIILEEEDPNFSGTLLAFCRSTPINMSDKFLIDQFGASEIVPTQFEPGQRILGIWRPTVADWTLPKSGPNRIRDRSRDAETILRLFSQLSDIFYTIEPIRNHWNVFGYQIRSLIIEIFTEIEYYFKYFYNLVFHKIGNHTGDYIKVREKVFLDDFCVNMAKQPELDIIRPFIDWDRKNPSKSIEWYNNYNFCKHGKHERISHANISTACNSFAALIILYSIKYHPRILNPKICGINIDTSLNPIYENFEIIIQNTNPSTTYYPFFRPRDKTNENWHIYSNIFNEELNPLISWNS